MCGEQLISVLDLLEAFYSCEAPNEKLSMFKRIYNEKTEGHVGARRNLDEPIIKKYLNQFFHRTSLPLFFLFHGTAKNNSYVEYGKRCFAYPLTLNNTKSPLFDESFSNNFLSVILLLNIKYQYVHFERECENTVVDEFDEQSSFFKRMIHDVEGSYNFSPIHINAEEEYPQMLNFSAIHVDPSTIISTQYHDVKNVEYKGGLYILLDF